MWHCQLKYYVIVVALRHEVTQLPCLNLSAVLAFKSDDDNMNIDMPSWHSMKNLIWNAFLPKEKNALA